MGLLESGNDGAVREQKLGPDLAVRRIGVQSQTILVQGDWVRLDHAERALAGGYKPDFEPRDAEWGERFFHLSDPDGHELSFARPLTGDVAKRSAEFAHEWERTRG